jgi:lipopolysaccharide export system permease protein
MALVLPFSLTFTIPWGFLGVTLVFGRLSADNELVVEIQWSEHPRICIPVFVLATSSNRFDHYRVAPRAGSK